MNHFKNSITFKIFIWFLVYSILPLILFSAFTMYLNYQHVVKNNLVSLNRISRLNVEKIENFINDKIAVASTICEAPRIKEFLTQKKMKNI